MGPFVDLSTARPTGRHLRASEPPDLPPSSTPAWPSRDGVLALRGGKFCRCSFNGATLGLREVHLEDTPGEKMIAAQDSQRCPTRFGIVLTPSLAPARRHGGSLAHSTAFGTRGPTRVVAIVVLVRGRPRPNGPTMDRYTPPFYAPHWLSRWIQRFFGAP